MDLHDEFLSLIGLEQLGLNDALIREAHDPKHPDMSPEAIEQRLPESRTALHARAGLTESDVGLARRHH